jgi:ABC-type ATPase with predicted acetyltransferase domain
MKLSVAYDFLPKKQSTHASIVMDHFGIGFETGRHIIADELELPVEQGDVVCFTGPSGSGKSSLLRAAAEQLEGVVDLATVNLGDAILVDALGLPARDALELLAHCGLGEARLLLRRPQELSEGQRYRFRLASALAHRPQWVVADEFSATLDRTLAKVIAYGVRRLSRRTGTGFLLATTHEDILDDLQPSLHVACRLDGGIECRRGDVKKKHSASPATSGSAWAPSPTGVG